MTPRQEDQIAAAAIALFSAVALVVVAIVLWLVDIREHRAARSTLTRGRNRDILTRNPLE